jgi:hypothetical protein
LSKLDNFNEMNHFIPRCDQSEITSEEFSWESLKKKFDEQGLPRVGLNLPDLDYEP